MSTNTSANNKLIAKNTLFLYFRSIIILGISLYTSRVVLDVIGVEDYGVYNLVGGIVTMFAMISSTIASASQRFITFAIGENKLEQLVKVFSTSVMLHIIIACACVFILEVLGLYFINNQLNIPFGRLDAAVWVLHFSILALFFNILSVPFNALIVAHEKMNVFAYISLLEAGLKLSIVFLVAQAGYDKLIFYSILVSLVAILIVFIYFVYSRKMFIEARSFSLKFDRETFKNMFAFSGWNLLGNGSLVLRNQGVDMILNVFYGVTVNAAKGISNQVQNAVTMFVSNFITALNPQLTKSIASNDIQRRDFLILQGGRLSFYLYSMFIIPLLIVVPQVLSLWLVDVPEYTIEFVRWLLLYSLLDSLSRLLITSILANGKIRNYEITVSAVKLLAMPLVYFILAFLYNDVLVGVWVNMALEVVCLIIRLAYMRNLLHFDVAKYVKDVIARCLLIFIFACGINFLFAHYITNNIFVFVPICIVICGIIILCFGLEEPERTWLLSIIKHKMRKYNE